MTSPRDSRLRAYAALTLAVAGVTWSAAVRAGDRTLRPFDQQDNQYDARVAAGHDRDGKRQPWSGGGEAKAAAGGLCTTGPDYLRFLVHSLAHGHRMFEPQARIDDELAWGLGWGIEESDGGETYRHAGIVDWQRSGSSDSTRLTAYVQRYGVQLFHNFTYFLNDPENGDQFEQYEQRWTTGAKLTHRRLLRIGGKSTENAFGVDLRNDSVGGPLGLYHTRARTRLGTVREDRVAETSAGVHAQTSLQWSRTFRTVMGLRADRYRFETGASGGATQTFLLVVEQPNVSQAPNGDQVAIMSFSITFKTAAGNVIDRQPGEKTEQLARRTTGMAPRDQVPERRLCPVPDRLRPIDGRHGIDRDDAAQPMERLAQVRLAVAEIRAEAQVYGCHASPEGHPPAWPAAVAHRTDAKAQDQSGQQAGKAGGSRGRSYRPPLAAGARGEAARASRRCVLRAARGTHEPPHPASYPCRPALFVEPPRRPARRHVHDEWCNSRRAVKPWPDRRNARTPHDLTKRRLCMTTCHHGRPVHIGRR